MIIGLGQSSCDPATIHTNIELELGPFRHFLELAVLLEDDWQEDIAQCSRLITKLCVHEDLRVTLLNKVKLGKRQSNGFGGPNLSFNLEEEMAFDKKQHSFDTLNNF